MADLYIYRHWNGRVSIYASDGGVLVEDVDKGSYGSAMTNALEIIGVQDASNAETLA